MCLIVVDLFDARVRMCVYGLCPPYTTLSECSVDLSYSLQTFTAFYVRSATFLRLFWFIPLGFRGGLVADRWGFQTLFYTGVGDQLHGLAPCDVFMRESNPRLSVVSVYLIR